MTPPFGSTQGRSGVPRMCLFSLTVTNLSQITFSQIGAGLDHAFFHQHAVFHHRALLHAHRAEDDLFSTVPSTMLARGHQEFLTSEPGAYRAGGVRGFCEIWRSGLNSSRRTSRRSKSMLERKYSWTPSICAM
jgi:hypothetical protein